MLQTLIPYTSTAKTAEIMARYRPIAPRPQGPLPSNGDGSSSSASASASASSPSSMSPTISQSPYLRSIWPHLQSRPTRTRKRGRTSLGPPPLSSFKRPRTLLQGLSPPFHFSTSPARHLAIHGFALPTFAPLHPATLVTLPLLAPPPHPLSTHRMQSNGIDLNQVAEVPEEKDLLAQLQNPTTDVFSPTATRLIPSKVSIRGIKDGTHGFSQVLKKAEEVEKELEAQVLPAFVSDSNNRVRLVNSAYREMIGQPDCAWLESTIACKSICGEVVLKFRDKEQDVRVLSGGFSCWARIEWGMDGKKNLVNAFGEAMRLACQSKDYQFAWRFHTREASEAASNV